MTSVFLRPHVCLVAGRAREIRIGLIGLDTSHVTAFTKIINDPKAEGPLANAGSRPLSRWQPGYPLQLRAR